MAGSDRAGGDWDGQLRECVSSALERHGGGYLSHAVSRLIIPSIEVLFAALFGEFDLA